jgi:hypothetical protein
MVDEVINTYDLNSAQFSNEVDKIKKGYSDIAKAEQKVRIESLKTKGIIERTEEQIKQTIELRRKATDTRQIAAYNKQLERQRTMLQRLNSEGVKVEKTTNALSNTMKKLGAAVGIAFSLNAIKNFMVQSVKLYDIQEKAEAKLLQALNGRVSTQKALLTQASALQRITLFGDEETIKAQALVAMFIKEEEKIKTLIPLIQDFATAKEMDLKTASDLVTKSIASGTNALTRYGIQVEGSAGSTERYQAVVDGLTKAFKGQAEAAAQAGTGGLKQLMNRLGDMRERMVKNTVAFLGLNKEVKTNQERLEDLRGEMNADFQVLTSTNLSTEARMDLIESINIKYATYLPNLLTEKSTLSDIEKAQKGANDEMMKKIIIAAMQEDYNSLLSKQVELMKQSSAIEIEAKKIEMQRFEVTDNQQAAALENRKIINETSKALNEAQRKQYAEEEKAFKEMYSEMAKQAGTTFDQLWTDAQKSTSAITETDEAVKDLTMSLENLWTESQKGFPFMDAWSGKEFDDMMKAMKEYNSTYEEWVNEDLPMLVDGELAWIEFLKSGEKNYWDWKNKMRETNLENEQAAIEKERDLQLQRLDLALQATGAIKSLLYELSDDNKKYVEFIEALGIIEVIINAMIASSNALKESMKTGEPVSALTKAAIVISAIGGISAGLLAIIKSQKTPSVPGFAEGVIDLQGKGTETSDSIPAMLSAHESVMTAKETRSHYDELQAMRDGTFNDLIYEKYVKPSNESFADNMLKNLSLQADLNDERIVKKLTLGNMIAIKNTGLLLKELSKRQIRR